MTNRVPVPPTMMPTVLRTTTCQIHRKQYPQSPCVWVYDCERMMLRPAVDMRIRTRVRPAWSSEETCRRWRRKTGKRPKTWIEKRDREKTAVVVGRRDASTVLAISAALVERLDGKGAAGPGLRGADVVVAGDGVRVLVAEIEEGWIGGLVVGADLCWF